MSFSTFFAMTSKVISLNVWFASGMALIITYIVAAAATAAMSRTGRSSR